MSGTAVVEGEFLTVGSEIALQIVPDAVDANIGYVGTTTSDNNSCWVNYLVGDSGSAPGPKNPRHIRFTVCPPTRYKEKRTWLEAEENWAADPSLYTQAQMDEIRFEADRDREDFERLKGSPIIFGQRISLHQYNTGDTLSFSTIPSKASSSGADTQQDQDVLTQTKAHAWRRRHDKWRMG